jgi:hypothetical protein
MTKVLVSCALVAMTFAAAPQPLKATNEDTLCRLGNATLRGTYMLRGEGTIVGVGPATVVGWLTYDGKGNVVNSSMTASVNGVISRFTISGPYTVNSDCSGSTELSGGHYDFVVSPDGNRVNWIQTDPGTVSSGTEVRLKPTDARDDVRESSRNRDAIEIPLDRAAIECVHVTRRS